MRASQASNVDVDQVGSMREGVLSQKHLLIGEDGSPNNFDLNTGLAGAGGWRTPRHRHDFDQIRYVIKGDYPYMDGKVLPEGWVAYFPESVYYGPQDRPEGLQTMVLQLGGASGNGYLSVAGRDAANAALQATGTFKGGKYIYQDDAGATHEQDASEACFEHATGRKLRFAEPRYDAVVVMNPAAYAWLPGDTLGVSVKWMGSFTERAARIGFIRIDAGAVFEGGMMAQTAILYQTSGQVVVDGTDYGPGSAFEFLAGEGPIPVTATDEAEFLCMTLHSF